MLTKLTITLGALRIVDQAVNREKHREIERQEDVRRSKITYEERAMEDRVTYLRRMR